MNNTKRNRAISKVETTAARLLARAEAVAAAPLPWSKQTHQESLLSEAREYAKAVDSLGKLPV